MATCRACGAKDQSASFCVRCGAALSDGRSLRENAESGVNPSSPPPPYVQPIQSPPGNPPSGAPQPELGKKRPWLVIGGITAAIAILTGVGVYVLNHSTGPTAFRSDPSELSAQLSTGYSAAPSTTTNPNSTAEPTAPVPPASAAQPVVTLTVVVTPTTTSRPQTPAPPSTTKAPPKTKVVPIEPMGGVHRPIACDSGYILQIASDLTLQDYVARVAQIRRAKMLPADGIWTQTQESTSCPIFGGNTNAYVLYAGPFASPYDACPARLKSPPDAFIRGTTPGVTASFSCLCPTNPATLPVVPGPGDNQVRIGDLQQALRTLHYGIADIDGPPSAAGIYTSGTAAAVTKFQTDNGLSPTGIVDATTWSAIISATAC